LLNSQITLRPFSQPEVAVMDRNSVQSTNGLRQRREAEKHKKGCLEIPNSSEKFKVNVLDAYE